MPNNSPIIFLAGHGIVDGSYEISDHLLAQHNIVFPSKLKGQLCFVAHNMIFQSLIDRPQEALERLEHVHGVSTVSTANREQRAEVEFMKDNMADLRIHDHRHQLRIFAQNIHKIIKATDILECQGLEADLVASNFSKLAVGLFHDLKIEDFRRLFQDLAICQNFIDSIEKLLIPTALLEHKLGSWEQSMKSYPWQQDMPFDPSKNGYITHAITSSTDRGVNEKRLTVYIDRSKIQEAPNPIPEVFNRNAIDASQVLYITTSAKQHVLLSEILDILHKIHIYVSIKKENKEKDIRDISVDLRESPADLEGDTELYDWYDFTIPDDANIVSGACRDVAADF